MNKRNKSLTTECTPKTCLNSIEMIMGVTTISCKVALRSKHFAMVLQTRQAAALTQTRLSSQTMSRSLYDMHDLTYFHEFCAQHDEPGMLLNKPNTQAFRKTLLRPLYLAQYDKYLDRLLSVLHTKQPASDSRSIVP